jgi:hypothetical protein
MRMKREAARAVAASLMVAASAGACAADAMPTGAAIPAEAFFGTSEMYGPRLSPQGDALAVLIRGGDNRRVLAVLDLKDLKKVKVVAASRAWRMPRAPASQALATGATRRSWAWCATGSCTAAASPGQRFPTST